MIYLSGFRFPDAAQEANYMANDPIVPPFFAGIDHGTVQSR